MWKAGPTLEEVKIKRGLWPMPPDCLCLHCAGKGSGLLSSSWGLVWIRVQVGEGSDDWVWAQKVPYCLGGMVRAVERLKLKLRWGAIGEVRSVFRTRILPGEQNPKGSEVLMKIKPDLFQPTCTLFPEWLSPLLG